LISRWVAAAPGERMGDLVQVSRLQQSATDRSHVAWEMSQIAARTAQELAITGRPEEARSAAVQYGTEVGESDMPKYRTTATTCARACIRRGAGCVKVMEVQQGDANPVLEAIMTSTTVHRGEVHITRGSKLQGTTHVLEKLLGAQKVYLPPPSELEGPALRAGPTLLQEREWNGKGHEPSPTYFTDIGKASNLWKAALQDPKLKGFAAKHNERFMLSFRSITRNSNGSFNGSVEIYANYKDPRNRTVEVKGLPAQAALGQLKKSGEQEPVLPFPLCVYTKEGSAVSYREITGSDVAEAAAFLGARRTAPAWDPRSPTYDQIGTYGLRNIRITDVRLSPYGEVAVSYAPTFVAEPSYRTLPSPPQPEGQTAYVSLKDFLTSKQRPRQLNGAARAIAQSLGLAWLPRGEALRE